MGKVVVRQGARVTALWSTISAAMHRERPVRMRMMMILLGLFVFASLHVAFSGAVCFAHIHNYGQGDVSCGDHRATDCSKCPCDPQGLSRGEFWCNGDCHWNRTINECKETGKKTQQRIISDSSHASKWTQIQNFSCTIDDNTDPTDSGADHDDEEDWEWKPDSGPSFEYGEPTYDLLQRPSIDIVPEPQPRYAASPGQARNKAHDESGCLHMKKFQ